MSEATLESLRDRTGSGPPGLVGDAFVSRCDDDGAFQADCAACGHRSGPATGDPNLGAVMSERSIADLSGLNAAGMVDRLVAISVQLQAADLGQCPAKGDAVMLDRADAAPTQETDGHIQHRRRQRRDVHGLRRSRR